MQQAARFWPGLQDLPSDRRAISALDILGALYFALLSLGGLVWLVIASDWSLLAKEGLLIVVLLVLLIPLNRYSFFMYSEVSPGKNTTISSSLDVVVNWMAAFLLGPVGLWLGVVSTLVRLALGLRGDTQTSSRWGTLRNEMSNLAENTLTRLAALEVYRVIGGTLPMTGLDLRTVIFGLVATIAMLFFQQVISVPVYFLLSAGISAIDPFISPLRIVRFIVVSEALMAAGTPFAVLAAGLYAEYGLLMLLFFLGGIVMVSYIANRSSRTALLSQQQSRLMEGLESLARELLLAHPDEDALLNSISNHIRSSRLHLPGRVEIRLFPDRVILHEPDLWPSLPESAWDWLKENPGTHHFKPGGTLPWEEPNRERCTALVSIEDYDTGQMIGGIYHSLSMRGIIDRHLYRMYLPALESLSDQVALALRRVKNYQQLVAHQRVEQELRVAGDIQGGFLPDRFPEVAGWKLSAVLVSARDTSGDFFDFFAIPDGRVGIVLADVADKGIGAALYMALSRAYLRSQALENDPQPPRALAALNRRVMQDTSSDLFVTLVYGIVAPNQDEFLYCNAGHPPPFIIRKDPSSAVEYMPRTGMAVGVVEESTWQPASVRLEEGDFIVIYSDGVTDAQNDAGEDFGLERLLAEAKNLRGHPPAEVRKHLMDAVQAYSGSTQADDITLLVLGKADAG